jgi:hypothetical protein
MTAPAPNANKKVVGNAFASNCNVTDPSQVSRIPYLLPIVSLTAFGAFVVLFYQTSSGMICANGGQFRPIFGDRV